MASQWGNELSDFILPFKTAYSHTFVPKGCQLKKVEYPILTDHAYVQHIKRDEAQIAFRIHYAANTKTRRQGPSTLLVLWHEGHLWWPHGSDVDLYRPSSVGQRSEFQTTAEQWKDELGKQRDLLKVVPSGNPIVDAESFSRFPSSNDSGEIEARLRKALAKNYLVCDDRVFRRGGPPVYVWWREPDRSKMLAVVSSGSDRDVAEVRDLYTPPAFHENDKTQLAFRMGKVWSPADEQSMTRHMKLSGSYAPRIEIVMPELLSPSLALDVQVDAIFRETGWLLKRIVRHAFEVERSRNPAWSWLSLVEEYDLVEEINATYKGAIEPKPSLNETTLSRRAALRFILDPLQFSVPYGPSAQLKSFFRVFQDLELRYPHHELTDEDLDALSERGFF